VARPRCSRVSPVNPVVRHLPVVSPRASPVGSLASLLQAARRVVLRPVVRQAANRVNQVSPVRAGRVVMLGSSSSVVVLHRRAEAARPDHQPARRSEVDRTQG